MLARVSVAVCLASLAASASAQSAEVVVPESYRVPQRGDAERPPPADPPPTRPRPRAEGDPQRVVLMPTAFTLREGERSLNAYELVSVETDSAVADISAADLEANPEKFRDRRVRWTVQFISLERAEAVRTDFYEGEPFILARAPEPSHGFVYLAVPEPLLPRARELSPLQSIDVLARVRTGRSALMGVPVLELITIY